ncbi:flippase [Candidatus Uabimicrobium amorphum]|uniref:Teichoic acid transporter n=1 Tax=Uabimicrobium amorphum TaxID=2596890 RepID=A0A5S9F6R8_UABAM|nr:flippase [Candidatus Uabimicrobium amorphum]BBM86914.1 teichoic acid transporter [Candidatus Uabimicrobium amorphum]
MRKKYNIVINTVTNYGRDILDVVIFLYLIPFIIHTLGKETFGLWSLIWAFVSLFALLDFGFGPSVVKYVGKARGEGNSQQEQRAIATLFWIYTLLGSVLFISVATCTLFFNSIFEIPAHQQQAAKHVLLILGCRAALCMPLELFRGVLVSYHQYRVANVYKMIASILYLLTAIVLLSLIPDLRTLALVNSVIGILPLLAMHVHLRRFYKHISIHPRHVDLSMVKEMSSFSMYFFIVQISTLIYTRVDSFIIQKYLSLEMVALYSIAMRITEKAQRFCTQIAKTLTPIISELHGEKQKQKVIDVWLKGAKYTTAFAAPLLIGLFILSYPIITSWAGENFADATMACQLLVAAIFINIIHSNTNIVLTMCDQQKYFAKVTIFGQLLNFALSIVLIRHLQIEGVALATLISTAVSYFLFVQVKACRLFEIGIWHFYQKICVPSLLPSLAVIFFLSGMQIIYPATNLWFVAIYEGVAVLLFVILFVCFSLGDDEKQNLKRKLRKK